MWMFYRDASQVIVCTQTIASLFTEMNDVEVASQEIAWKQGKLYVLGGSDQLCTLQTSFRGVNRIQYTMLLEDWFKAIVSLQDHAY